MSNSESILRIGQRCIFCAEMLEPTGVRASIHVLDLERPNFEYHLDAHAECMRKAARPQMLESVERSLHYAASPHSLNVGDTPTARAFWNRWLGIRKRSSRRIG